tara:strand:- start:73 stop:225 length:153 start_codon:yes stop_codon:yes gene_type:complete
MKKNVSVNVDVSSATAAAVVTVNVASVSAVVSVVDHMRGCPGFDVVIERR